MKFKPKNFKCTNCGNETYVAYDVCLKCSQMYTLQPIGAAIGKNINFEDEPTKISFETALDEVLKELKETLIMKNKNYGDSFFKQIDEWGPAAIMIPIANKTDRLKTLYKNRQTSALTPTGEESVKDSHMDNAGYNVLTLVYKKLRG